MNKKQSEKYLIVSDFHVPDHDIKTFDLLLKFIPFYKPSHLDILGDFVNFSKVSKHEQDPYYKTDFADEINEARGVLRQLVTTARKANPNVEISYFEGNHSYWLSKYLARNAQQLALLTSDGEYIVSVPHLLEFKKLGVKWIPEHRITQRHGITFTHGQNVRMKSGFTAHANIDKFGTSGFSGHTHRACMVTRTQSKVTKFWVETGCMCNSSPTPSYTFSPDWCQAFATAEYADGQWYPQIVPIINHSFIYEGKLFI